MDTIRNHFEEEAEAFDEIIVRRVPRYGEMIDVLVSALPFDENREITVLDIGCGTGTITKKLKQRYPKARVTCLDLAKNMVKVAQEKLKEYSDITFHNSNILDFEFPTSYDAIISSLTLHHIGERKDKQELYRKFYNNLTANGVFYNADITLWSTEYLMNVYMKKWGEFMADRLSEKEVQDTFNKYHAEDRPFRVLDELSWVKESGFNNIEIIWRCYNSAVYGGEK